MNDTKLNIKLSEGQETVTILHGTAPDPVNLKGYEVTGNLEAPKDFAGKNKALISEKESVVIVDQSQNRIALVIGYNHPENIVIKGMLLLDPDFRALGVNTGKQYSRYDLVQQLKFMRRFFPTKSDCLVLVDAFKKLETNFTTVINQKDDERGNKMLLLEQVVEDVNFPESFDLKIPVILGGQPEEFTVNIQFDVQHGNSLVFWLESVDAKDIVFESSSEQLKKSVASFKTNPDTPVLFQ